MGKKGKLAVGQKKTVSRMFDLEVDEVSAVDKPAIGEDFIVTKSVNGKGDTVGKKNVKKNEKEKDPKAGADANAEDKDSAKAGAAEGEQDQEENTEGADDEGAEGGEAADEGGDEDSGEGDGEQDGDDESAEADRAESEKRMKGLEAAQKASGETLAEMQETLEGLLELHDMAAGAMNAMLAMTVHAFQMCAGMMEMGTDTEMSEAHAKALADIKKSLGDTQAEVQKAGAKISAQRLSVLQEIATKLTSLLAEVQAAQKEGKKGGKKKSEELEAVEKRAADLEGQLKAQGDELKTAKEDVTKLANRLNELETSAGASSAVEEDEDDDSSSSQTKSKSVFAGLIPVDDIKKRNAERAKFLGRKQGEGKEENKT